MFKKNIGTTLLITQVERSDSLFEILTQIKLQTQYTIDASSISNFILSFNIQVKNAIINSEDLQDIIELFSNYNGKYQKDVEEIKLQLSRCKKTLTKIKINPTQTRQQLDE